MNTDQIASYLRSALKIIGSILLAHGYTKAGGEVNNMLTMPDVLGFVATGIGLAWSYFTHASPSTPKGGGSASGTAALLVALLAAGLCFTGTGCKSGPQTVAYQSAAATTITVETALKAYDAFAAAGKTTPAQNLAVKNAFEKYQVAFALVCDAGMIYSASNTTNAPAAAALQTAVVNANQSITDLIALVASFGVTLK